MGCRKGQGGGGKKGGGRGVGWWGGEGGGERGWGEALIEVLNKTGIISFSSVIGMHITRRNQPKIAIFEGNPRFFGGIPCNDITFSEIHHNLARKKSENEMCGRFHACDGAIKKKPPSWKTEYLAHFEFSNSNISILGHYFKPKMEIWTDFTVIWRWYKRLVTAFSSFWVKIGGSSAHGSKISN